MFFGGSLPHSVPAIKRKTLITFRSVWALSNNVSRYSQKPEQSWINDLQKEGNEYVEVGN